MKYKTLKGFLVFVILLFVLGSSLDYFVKDREVYPFFSWNLFSGIANEETSYFIKVIEFEGQEEEKLLVGEEVENHLEIERVTEFYWMVQEFGRSIKEGRDDSTKKEINRLFEEKSVKYQVVLLEYDPYEFKKEGRYKNEKVVGEFEVE